MALYSDLARLVQDRGEEKPQTMNISSVETAVVYSVPLTFEAGHVFVKLPEGSFLIDTGSPISFGRVSSLVLDEQRFQLSKSWMGMLNASELSGYVGRETDGLLGTNILNNFDILLDVPHSQVHFAKADLNCEGEQLPLDFSMNVPLVNALVDQRPVKLFFDTGAQVSYFQGDCLLQYPVEGTVMDFYPGLGPFSTDSFRMPIQLGGSRYRLQCGQLPKSLESALMVAETNGIVGSELLRGRCVGYFPRRQQLILGHD